jgi:hypothetical protein
MPRSKSVPSVFSQASVSAFVSELPPQVVHLFLPDFVSGAIVVKVMVLAFQLGALLLQHDTQPVEFLFPLFREISSPFSFRSGTAVAAAVEIGNQ